MGFEEWIKEHRVLVGNIGLWTLLLIALVIMIYAFMFMRDCDDCVQMGLCGNLSQDQIDMDNIDFDYSPDGELITMNIEEETIKNINNAKV